VPARPHAAPTVSPYDHTCKAVHVFTSTSREAFVSSAMTSREGHAQGEPQHAEGRG